jgi:hypothetical protein
VEVLVAISHDADYFFSINVVLDKLASLFISVGQDFREDVAWLPDEVHRLVAELKRLHMQVVELYLLVKHIHRSVETLLNVVFDVWTTKPHLLYEGWVVGSRAASRNRRLNIIPVQREANVSCWDTVLGYAELVCSLLINVLDYVVELNVWLCDAVFSDDQVGLDKVVNNAFCREFLQRTLLTSLSEDDLLDGGVSNELLQLGTSLD